MRSLNCAGFNACTSANGPGVRSVLFLQGCSRHCPGCQNANTHDSQKGIVMPVDEVFCRISKACRNKRVTISGGEPLEQPEALYELLRLLKSNNFDTCLYTGSVIEEVPKEFLHYLDYIKCGPYRKELKTYNDQYYGSANQVFYAVKAGKPEIYKEARQA